MRRFGLTPAQEAMLIGAISEPSRYITRLRFALPEGTDEAALAARMQLLIERHEALRTTFIRGGAGEFLQEVTDSADEKLFLAELGNGELKIAFHHALLDGWSIGVLLGELFSEEAPRGQAQPFRYYKKWLSARDYAEDLAWYKRYLGESTACTAFPNAAEPGGYERRGLCFTLPDSALLRRRAAELRVTAGRLIEAVWCMLAARYTYDGVSVVCTVNSGRGAPVPGITGMVGMCLNTLPIVTALPKQPDVTFADWLAAWFGRAAEAGRRGFCALGDLISGTMTHLLAIEPPLDAPCELISSSARLVTDFDVVFTLGDDITAEFAYNAFVYSDEAISAVRGHFLTALSAVLTNPMIAMDDIPILTAAETARLTAVSKNDGILSAIERFTLADFWKESAKAHAQRIALVCGDTRLTYAKLAEEAGRLAAALVDLGAGVETPVAICLERSERYVIAELAVVLACGFFLPVDPEWPEERIGLILERAKPAAIIDDKTYGALIKGGSLPSPAPAAPKPGDAAYMIMTSGTMGIPKGVVVTHRNVANFCMWARERYGWRPGDAAALVLGFGFDGSLWDIWLPLISGGTLHILEDETRMSISALCDYCARERITHIDLPVALANSFREAGRALSDLRVMVSGGEQVRWVSPAPYPLSNEYGPTECTVCCAAGWLDGEAPITVGAPVANMAAYILDDRGRLLPEGAVGEAYFAGAQVARGYYGETELSAERFITNPFSSDACFRAMYRTGDLMRWAAQGGGRELVFCGRTDAQIKLNGFRIELGEIESALLIHPAVRQAAAFFDGARIFAYAAAEADAADLDAHLAAKLPAFMRPTVVLTEALPLNASGKVDLSRLPRVEGKAREHTPPPNEREKALAHAVSRVLECEIADISDNYIALGGNSISAMRVAFLLEKAGWTLGAKELLTGASLAVAAANMRPFAPEGSEEPPRETFTPLPAQLAMLFLAEASPGMYAVTLCADAGDLDEATLKLRFGRALELHDILRTTFEKDANGRVIGRVHTAAEEFKPAAEASLEAEKLVLRYHHAALDGHSAALLAKELLGGEFPESAPSFAAFAERLASKAQAEDERWWRKQCENARLFPLLPPAAAKAPEFKRIGVSVPRGFSAAAQGLRVTRAAFALAAWGVVLGALNAGGGDLLIPFVASCRDNPHLMGMCAAALPLRFTHGGDAFADAARDVQAAMRESVSHWFAPQDIISKLPDYLFAYEDGADAFAASGEQNYDLVIKFSDAAELIYNAARVPDILANELAARLSAALFAATQDRLSAYLPGEYERAAEIFPRGGALHVTHSTAAEAFIAAAQAHENRVALETESETLTYAQLLERARGFANDLAQKGLGAGSIAPICLARGGEGIIAQLGAALNGAAFWPIDPEWPKSRREYLLGVAAKEKVTDDTAYVLSTSGTTGKPKCASLPNAALANQIAWAQAEFGIGPDDKVLHYVNFTFDPSVFTLFAALCSGAALSVMPECVRLDPAAAARYIEERGITVCVLPSAVAPEILCRLGARSRLRLALLGGESVKNLPANRRYDVFNCYGPTEACVNAAFYKLAAHETETRVIGRPVANTSLYVLNARGKPCPFGVAGDLHIGGVQLAHGYLGSPEESAAAFIVHPMLGRLYKTGDLAAWGEDGALEFHGRRDRQIKLRGHRVELEEVEAALRALPGVADAAVRPRGGLLDAYITGTASGEYVQGALAKRLPSHMLPRSITLLERFPLTENGKLDMNALPEPKAAGEAGRELTQMERAVARAWRMALGLPESYAIAPGDSFGELGGHSLLLFHVVGLLAARGIEADIKTLVEHQRLSELAEAIARRKGAPAAARPKPAATDAAYYGQYAEAAKKLNLNRKRAFNNVVITGATGFLGSHLVREFYENTEAALHLPVRSGHEGLKKALTYYFGSLGNEMMESGRLRAVQADLAVGAPEPDAPPDAIFHAAADIRHYAPEREMYAANVAATEHVLALAKRADALLCHVSTTSAVNAPVIYETSRELGPEFENIYQRTKQLAEQRVLSAKNLKYAVFRVGHVSPGFGGGSVARNWEINAMLRLINAMLLTETLPEQDYRIGYGFVDKIARAIRLLSEPEGLLGMIFHIDNPNALPLSELFRLAGLRGSVMPRAEMTARLTALLSAQDAAVRRAAQEYLGRLAQGSLEKESADTVQGELHMDATLILLERLGFKWPYVTEEYMKRIVENLKRAGGEAA